MATWHTSSLQQSGEGEDDEESVDAHQSSYCSTPQEVIVEEDEEFGAQAFHHDDNSEFSIALKELKSIRSHLYSAADYCESAYMYSGKKKAIFENLKDYSVKALVNAVDHIGTVAAKLDDSLVKQIKNLSVIEFNVSRTSRQFQAFHDNKNSEGLIHFQLTKRNHVYGKQYVLKDPSVHGKPNDGSSHWRIVEDSNKLENKPDQTQYDSTSDTNIPNSLAWYIASEMPSDYSVTGPYVVSRLNSTNSRGEKKLQGTFY
ncbi:hypothetical protein KP509_06G001400 [Ceratopteris richardii]|uniref:Uncharacterized protein n=1 Tax=Ceratopteris richardii TaxID=49495 RepID=A0A8T2UCZ9_CERRI|nr:hypothetical protein KP509_06G001400 [Ceratopteris richardii]